MKNKKTEKKVLYVILWAFIFSYVLHLTWIFFQLIFLGKVMVHEYVTPVVVLEFILGIMCLIFIIINIVSLLKKD